MSRVHAHLSFSNVVAVVALFVALGGAALAAGNAFVGSGGVIQGCVGKHGALAVVKAHKQCPKHTTSLAFNQKGQAGKNGTNGPRDERDQRLRRASERGCRRQPQRDVPEAVARHERVAAVLGERSGGTGLHLEHVGGDELRLAQGPVRHVPRARADRHVRDVGRGAQGPIGVLPRTASRSGRDTVDWIAAMAPLTRGYQADGTLSLQAPFTGPAEIALGCKNLSTPGVAISAYLSRIDAIRTTSNH